MYPQNGDSIVTIGSVTSLRRMNNGFIVLLFRVHGGHKTVTESLLTTISSKQPEQSIAKVVVVEG